MPGHSRWSGWGAPASFPLCTWLQSTLPFLFSGFPVRPQCLQSEVLINCLVLAATGDLIGDSRFLHFKDEEIDILRD